MNLHFFSHSIVLLLFVFFSQGSYTQPQSSKGMIQASKTLALTIIDYLKSPELQMNIQQDFERRKKSYRYRSFLSAGPASITKSTENR